MNMHMPWQSTKYYIIWFVLVDRWLAVSRWSESDCELNQDQVPLFSHAVLFKAHERATKDKQLVRTLRVICVSDGICDS